MFTRTRIQPTSATTPSGASGANCSDNSIQVQRKPEIGSAHDPYEREADAAADSIMRMPESHFIQRKCADCEEEESVQ